MIINVRFSLTVFYHIHAAHSLCWNLGQEAQTCLRPSDSAFLVCMWLNGTEIFSIIDFLVQFIFTLQILLQRTPYFTCFCPRLSELWVNISSVKVTPRLTFLFSCFFFLFSRKTCHRNTYILMLSQKQTINNSKCRITEIFLKGKIRNRHSAFESNWFLNYHNPILLIPLLMLPILSFNLDFKPIHVKWYTSSNSKNTFSIDKHVHRKS